MLAAPTAPLVPALPYSSPPLPARPPAAPPDPPTPPEPPLPINPALPPLPPACPGAPEAPLAPLPISQPPATPLAPVPAAPVTPLPNKGRPVNSCQGEKYGRLGPTSGVQGPCDVNAPNNGTLAASVAVYTPPAPDSAWANAVWNAPACTPAAWNAWAWERNNAAIAADTSSPAAATTDVVTGTAAAWAWAIPAPIPLTCCAAAPNTSGDKAKNDIGSLSRRQIPALGETLAVSRGFGEGPWPPEPGPAGARPA